MAAAEQKKSYQVIKVFEGINTQATRTAIKESEFSWLENAQPIGNSNLKIVPAQNNVYDSTGNAVTWSNTTTYISTVNIGLYDYIVSFQENGGAEYFNIETKTKGTIAAPGYFSNAGISVSQYENQYMLILDPYKGYFTWDSNSVVTVGSVGVIAITNPGSGYSYAPTVTLSAPNDANGIQATAVATISAGTGGVIGFNVLSGGTGYTSVPLVTIGAPNLSNGTQATAYATISGGAVVALTVSNQGSGYTSPPSVSISGGGGTGATANSVIDTGILTSITLTEAGSGYTSPPTITITGGGGNNATAIAQTVSFQYGILTLYVQNGGTGYTSAPTLTISGGGGTGANATAIVQGNTITQVIMTNFGSGYTNASNVTVTITGGGGSNAVIKATVNNNTNQSIATFSGRVWIASGRTLYYSAAGSATDFTSVSAGSDTIVDSTLHGNIQYLLAANNFLYFFGDDSINVISDLIVQSNGTTVYTNTNISASVGSNKIYAIFPYFRSVLFMNEYGVYALVGATTTKLSDALDGLLNDIQFNQPIYAGQALINNLLCAVFNFQIYDDEFYPNSPYRYVQAVFFNKKWFLTSQDNNLSNIVSVPAGGLVTLYGTSGNNLLQLYANSTANISTIVQTALLPMGDPIRTKQALKFGVEATLNNGGQFYVTVDSESQQSPQVMLSNTVPWTNNQGNTINWTNNASTVIAWVYSNGYVLYKSDAQMWGKYVGLTLTSQSPNYIINTFEFEHELRTRF